MIFLARAVQTVCPVPRVPCVLRVYLVVGYYVTQAIRRPEHANDSAFKLVQSIALPRVVYTSLEV